MNTLANSSITLPLIHKANPFIIFLNLQSREA